MVMFVGRVGIEKSSGLRRRKTQREPTSVSGKSSHQAALVSLKEKQMPERRGQ